MGSLRPQPHVERASGVVAVSYMDEHGPLRNEFGIQQSLDFNAGEEEKEEEAVEEAEEDELSE